MNLSEVGLYLSLMCKKSVYTPWALYIFCEGTGEKIKVWQKPSTTFCSETHAEHFSTKS